MFRYAIVVGTQNRGMASQDIIMGLLIQQEMKARINTMVVYASVIEREAIMAIKQLPMHWETSDGRIFHIQIDAERHEHVLKTEEAFITAGYAYGRAMMEKVTTADGMRIESTLAHTYYYICKALNKMPYIKQVTFYRWNCSYDLRCGLTCSQFEDHQGVGYEVGSLYYHEKKAQVALMEAKREQIQAFQDDLNREMS